jgi:hypothetical protein
VRVSREMRIGRLTYFMGSFLLSLQFEVNTIQTATTTTTKNKEAVLSSSLSKLGCAGLPFRLYSNLHTIIKENLRDEER